MGSFFLWRCVLEDIVKNIKSDALKIPNIVTEIRLMLSLLPGLFVFFDNRVMSAAIFILIISTDWLDGFLARRLNQITMLGIIMDPIVDKVLVMFSLMFLSLNSRIALVVMIVYFYYYVMVLILMRKAGIEGRSPRPTYFGKFNMCFQYLTIVVLILPLGFTTQVIISITSCLLSVMSYITYYKKYA